MFSDNQIIENNGINYTYFESGNFFIVGTQNISSTDTSFNAYPNAVPNGSTIEEITIPKEIGGVPVLEIAGRAFRRCFSLKTVVINARLTRINMYAFYECINLTNINIPSSCEVIGHCAISCINNTKTANGSLAVKFEPNATIKYIGEFGIERKEVIIIFFCGYEPPKVQNRALFYGSTYNVVFAPKQMEWGNTTAIVDESVCLLIQETKERIKIQTCYSQSFYRLHSSPLFCIIFLDRHKSF